MNLLSFSLACFLWTVTFSERMSIDDLGKITEVHLIWAGRFSECEMVQFCMTDTNRGEICVEYVLHNAYEAKYKNQRALWLPFVDQFQGRDIYNIENMVFRGLYTDNCDVLDLRAIHVIVKNNRGTGRPFVVGHFESWDNTFARDGPWNWDFKEKGWIVPNWDWEYPPVPIFNDLPAGVPSPRTYAQTLFVYESIGGLMKDSKDAGSLTIGSDGVSYKFHQMYCPCTDDCSSCTPNNAEIGTIPTPYETNFWRHDTINNAKVPTIDINRMSQIEISDKADMGSCQPTLVENEVVIVETAPCIHWGCNCQGFVDFFGTFDGHWVCATNDNGGIDYWYDNGCDKIDGLMPTVNINDVPDFVHPACEEGRYFGTRLFVPVLSSAVYPNFDFSCDSKKNGITWDSEGAEDTETMYKRQFSYEWNGKAPGQGWKATVGFWTSKKTGNADGAVYQYSTTFTTTDERTDEQSQSESFSYGVSASLGISLETPKFAGFIPSMQYELAGEANADWDRASEIASAVTHAVETSKTEGCELTSPKVDGGYFTMWTWTTYRQSEMAPYGATMDSPCQDFVFKSGNCRWVAPNCLPGFCLDPECWSCTGSYDPIESKAFPCNPDDGSEINTRSMENISIFPETRKMKFGADGSIYERTYEPIFPADYDADVGFKRFEDIEWRITEEMIDGENQDAKAMRRSEERDLEVSLSVFGLPNDSRVTLAVKDGNAKYNITLSDGVYHLSKKSLGFMVDIVEEPKDKFCEFKDPLTLIDSIQLGLRCTEVETPVSEDEEEEEEDGGIDAYDEQDERVREALRRGYTLEQLKKKAKMKKAKKKIAKKSMYLDKETMKISKARLKRKMSHMKGPDKKIYYF